MSYFPILKAPECDGWVTLCNFAPNNWEDANPSEKLISATWIAERSWISKTIGTLAPGELRTIAVSDLVAHVSSPELILLSLSATALPAISPTLPRIDLPLSVVPAWRATLGLSTALASTSYQGELDPFPEKGSLLTFGPFLQYGPLIENYLILINLENSPVHRVSKVEIYDALQMQCRGEIEISNNDANVIDMDHFEFEPEELPVVVCRGMSAIPLYFSKTADGAFLSLEHTHPPASLVIHGNRWEAQRLLKKRWFSMIAS